MTTGDAPSLGSAAVTVPELQVGSQVWERSTGEVMRGGTVVEVDPDSMRVRVVSNVGRRSGKRYVETTWLAGEDLDPSLTVPAENRSHHRAGLARDLLDALGTGRRLPSPWDWRVLGWVVQLWLGHGNRGSLPTVGYSEVDGE